MKVTDAEIIALTKKVKMFIRSRVNNDADTEEILNDALFAAMRQKDEFEGRSTLSTWVIGIALRMILNRRRSYKPLEALPDDYDEATAEDPLAILEAKRMAEKIDRCFKSELLKEVFYTRILSQGKAEYAEAEGVNVGTAGSRFYRACQCVEAALS